MTAPSDGSLWDAEGALWCALSSRFDTDVPDLLAEEIFEAAPADVRVRLHEAGLPKGWPRPGRHREEYIEGRGLTPFYYVPEERRAEILDQIEEELGLVPDTTVEEEPEPPLTLRRWLGMFLGGGGG